MPDQLEIRGVATVDTAEGVSLTFQIFPGGEFLRLEGLEARAIIDNARMQVPQGGEESWACI